MMDRVVAETESVLLITGNTCTQCEQDELQDTWHEHGLVALAIAD